MSLVQRLLEYFDAPATLSFDLRPAQAIEYFRSKGLRTTFAWQDMVGEEHARAFTVAKMADIDLLADVKASLEDAIEQGLSFQSWRDTITPLLQQRGWWGRRAVTDPLTGETIVAELGSPSRLETIFRTNVQGSYAAGQWEQIQEQADVAEYLMYDAIDDDRTRPQHAAWDGTILPVGHSWWKAHYPPNGWNCRCGVLQLSAEDLEDMGLRPNKRAPAGGTRKWTNPRTGRTVDVEKGLDPGWNVNMGEQRLANLAKVAAEKVKALPPDAAKPAAVGLQAAERQAQAAAKDAGIAIAPVIEQTPAQISRGAGRAETRRADAAIAQALQANTPYIAQAITDLRATPAGQAMSAVELLATARATADATRAATLLDEWITARISGKRGSEEGKAVFDALPEPARQAILERIKRERGA